MIPLRSFQDPFNVLYNASQILHANNLHSQGYEDNNSKCLRSYDITILYGGDDASRLSGGTDVYSCLDL